MNLKEAFRTQNKIYELITEAQGILGRTSNVTKVTTTSLYKKVSPDMENETVVEAATTDYADNITDVARFIIRLMDEREKLSRAIRETKNALSLDFDGETSLNSVRQSVAATFAEMAAVKASEVTIPGGGTGYRFNNEGNQVPFRCDVEKVTTINFDRNVVRKYAAELHAESDRVSRELDLAIVNAEVKYEAPFNVNDGFGEIFDSFLSE